MMNIIERFNKIEQIIASRDTRQDDFVREVLLVPVERFFLIDQGVKKFSKEIFLYLDALNVFDFDTIPRKTENGFYGWDAGFLLRRASEANKDQFDKDINDVVLRIIDQYIDYAFNRKADSERNFRPDWFISDCILSLQLADITDKHFAFIREIAIPSPMTHVDSDLAEVFFKRVTNEKSERLCYLLLDIFYSPNPEMPEQYFELKSLIEGYVLRQFSDGSSEALLNAFGAPVIRWVINRVIELDDKYTSSFSKLLIVAVADDEQNWQRDSLSHAIIRQLRELLDCSSLSTEDRRSFSKELRDHDHGILRRVAIYTINKHFVELGELFWEIANPFVDTEWKLEVHKLIRAHAETFTPEQMQFLLGCIDSIPPGEPYEPYTAADMQRFNNSSKIEALQAFDGLKDWKEKIEAKKYELKTAGGVESNFPGYDSYSRFTVGGDYDENRIITQDLAQVSERLSDPQKWKGYDQYGLQQDLRQMVINRSDEVVRRLDKFMSVAPAFLYYVFDALRELLQKGTGTDRTKIFAFTQNLLASRDDFWNPEDPQNENGSMLGMICWMLRDAAEKEILTLSEMYSAVDILVMIDDRFTKPFVYLNAEKDKNFDIINSTRGKLYDALIHLSMKLAKPKEKEPDQRWYTPIRELFEKRLTDGSFFDEFYWTAGMYTPQLSYLDHKWWKERHELLYIITDKIKDYGFKAYLLYTRTVYGDIFEALQQYYYRSLELYTDQSAITDRLSEHALIAYVYEMDGGEKFLHSILASKRLSYLVHLVEFIDRRNMPLLSDTQLIGLWKYILELAEGIGDEKAGALIYNTAEFIDHLSEFTEESTTLFVRAVAYYRSNPYIHRFIEKIITKAAEQPALVGQMLEALLIKIQGDFSFNQTKILKALQILYENGQTERADRIVMHLAEQGNFYVRDLYNQIHNNPQ